MEYFNNLKGIKRCKKLELYTRRSEELWPIFDYKIINDELRLISDPAYSYPEGVTLSELMDYVKGEGDGPYRLVDELTGKDLEVQDQFETKLVFKICN